MYLKQGSALHRELSARAHSYFVSSSSQSTASSVACGSVAGLFDSLLSQPPLSAAASKAAASSSEGVEEIRVGREESDGRGSHESLVVGKEGIQILEGGEDGGDDEETWLQVSSSQFGFVFIM